MKVFVSVFAISALIFASSSCAKHEWEDTQGLHEGSHGDGHGGHGDAHHGKGAVEAKEAHGDVHTAKPAEGSQTPAAPKH